METNVFELYTTALSGVNYIAVLIATVASFILGFLWYSVLFRKPWSEASGITEETARGSNMILIFGLSFVLSFLIALHLAVLGGSNNITISVFNSTLAGLFFVVPSLGIIYLFEHKPLKLFLIDAGYLLAMFILDGFLIGVFINTI